MHSSDFEALEPRLLLDAAAAITLDAGQVDTTGPDQASQPATEDTSFKLSGVSVTDDEAADSYTLEVGLDAGSLAAGSSLSLDGGAAQNSLTLSGTAAEINARIGNIDVQPGENFTGEMTLQLTLKEGTDIRDTATFVAPVTPVNDAPTLDGGENSVQEGDTFTFSVEALGLADADVDSGEQGLDQLIIQIDTLPGDGKLTFNNAPVAQGSTFDASQLDKLKYVHSGNDVSVGESDSFTVTVFDGAGGEVSGALTISLEPKNEAPSLDGDPQQFEGESTGLGLSYTDSESGHADAPENALVEITDISGLAGRGTLFLDQNQDGIANASEIISDISDPAASFTADKLAMLAFAHDGDEPLAQVPSFTIRVTDNGGGEGDGAKLSATRTVDISILENNDDPVVVTVASPTDVANGDAGVTITGANLLAEDPDSAATQLVYSIVNGPDFGQIQLNLGDNASPNWVSLPATAVFTQADINAGNVRYVQTSFNAGTTEDTGFTFKLADSEFRAFDTAGQAGKWRDGAGNEQVGALSFQINDDNSNLGSSVGALDPNVTVDSSTNTGRANFDEGDASITLTDQHLEYILTAGGTYTLPSDQVVYTISQLPAHGTLSVDGRAVQSYGSFTQADINAGRVTFTHDGGENHQDGFNFIVTNGGDFQETGTFSIDTRPINDAPVAGDSTVSVTEATEANDGTVRLGINDLDMSDVDGSQDIAAGSPEDPNTEAGVDLLWFQITGLPEDGSLQRWNGSGWVDVTIDGAWYSRDLLTTSVDGGTSGLRYVHGGDDAVASLSDSLTFIVRDDLSTTADPLQPDTDSGAPAAGNVSGTGMVNLEVVPFNDAPIVPLTPDASDITVNDNNGNPLTTANDVLSVSEGATAVIGSGLLTAIDSDNTTRQATFRITNAVDNGDLLLSGKVLGAGSSFTQADIDAGLLSYEHDGSETRADSFQFVVSDGPLTTAEARFDINITASNDAAEIVSAPPVSDLLGDTSLALGNSFTVADVDIFDPDSGLGISAGETDTIRLTLALQFADGTPVPGGVNAASLNIDLTGAASVDVVSGVPGTDSRLVLTGTLADVQTVLTTLTAISNDDLNAQLQLVATVDDRIDGGAATNGGAGNEGGDAISTDNNTATASISLVASTDNNAPTGAITDQTITEDQPQILTGLSIGDQDSFDRDVSVTVTVGSGTLNVGATGGVSVASNGSAAVTLTGIVGDINAALGDITYTPGTDANGTTTLDLSVTDSDLHGTGTELTTDLAQATITINAVNDTPVLTVPGTQVLATGDNIAITGVVVADAKDSGASIFTDSQTVTVTVLNEAGDAAGTVETTSNTAATSLTITGTLAQINAELDSLIFTPDNTNNDAVARVEVTFNDDANGDPTNPGNAQSVSDIVQVNISGLNDIPVLVGNTTATVAEDTELSLDFLTVADPDDFGNTGMSIALTATHGTFASALGALSNGNRTLTLANATEAQLNALLEGAGYTADANYYGSDTISVSVNDGGNTGDGPVGGQIVNQDIAVTVTPVNDRPAANNASTTLTSIAEGTADPAGQTLSALLGTLYDDSADNQFANNGGSAADEGTALTYIAITGNTADAEQGQWQVEIGGDWVTVPAGVSDTNALIVSADTDVRFVPAADFNGVPDDLTVRLGDNSQPGLTTSTGAGDLRNLNSDGDLSSASSVWSNNAIAIETSITAVNDAPTTPQATVSLDAVAEDTTAPGGSTVADLLGANFNDDTDDQTQEAASGGSSADSFGGVALTGNTIDAAEGKWQFNTGGGWVDVPGDLAVDNALILDNTAQIRFLPATDFHGTPSSLQYVVADSNQTAVSGTRGDVTFSATGTWSDSASAAAITTSILARNDAPDLDVDLPDINNPATATENAGAGTGSNSIALATDALLSDVDILLGDDDFGGGSLTVTLTDPSVADVFAVNGSLEGFASQTIGNGTLTVSFDTGATAAQVAALVNSLTYTNTSDAPDESKRAFTLMVNDGNNNGQAGGPDALNSSAVIGYLQVENINDRPTIRVEAGDSTADTLTESDAGLTSSGTLSVTDLDTPDTVSSNVLSVSASGSTAGAPDNAALLAMFAVDSGNIVDNLNNDGSLNWAFDSDSEAFNYLAPGESLILAYTLQVEDSAGAATQQIVTITIDGSNDAATVSSDSQTLSESDAPVTAAGILTSLDVDNADNTFNATTISGTIGDFSIAANGAWTFTANSAFDNLNVGDSVNETFNVTTIDGTASTVQITIDGTNDAATVSSDVRSLTETDAPVSTSGTLTSTDLDNADNTFTANTVTGAIGNFSIDANGAWTFTANSAFDNLNVGDSVNETFNVTAVDGTASTVQITINGTNDAATVSSATQTLSETDAPVSASGTLTSSDIDNVNNAFTATTVNGTIGEFGIGAGGNWTFTANNTFNDLNVGESVNETFNVNSVDGTASTIAITITGSNDVPTVSVGAGDADSTALTENNSALTDAGTLSVVDLDTTDTVAVSVDSVASNGNANGLTNAQLQAMLSVDAAPIIDNANTDGTLNWSFDSNGETFNHLAVGESLVLTYTVAVTDGNGSITNKNIAVTINGSNDAPVITVDNGNGDADSASITETDAGLSTDGTLSVQDFDLSNTVAPSVSNVAVSGTTTGAPDNASLLAMLDVDAGNIINGLNTDGTLNWSFDSDGEAFNYLADGESLTLTYTVQVTDSSGAVDSQALTVTINGTNDAPVITVGAGDSDSQTLTETNDPLTSTGTLRTFDLDTSNTVTAAVASLTTTGDTGTLTLEALQNMLAVDNQNLVGAANNSGVISWTFDSRNEGFNYLAEGESLTLNYVIRVADSSGATSDQTVSITVAGTQDAPIIVTEQLPDSIAVSDSQTVEPVDASVAFIDSDNGTILIFAADNLPEGLSIDPDTGIISGTIDGAASQGGNTGEPGTYVATLTATDGDGNVGETNITLRVANPAPETVDTAVALEEDNVLSASGNLLTDASGAQLQTDPDGDSLFISSVNGTTIGGATQSIQGEFGQLTIDTNGEWRYALDNNAPTVQQLDQGQAVADVFTVVVDDGQGGRTPATLTLDIAGRSEPVVRSAVEEASLNVPEPLVPDAGGPAGFTRGIGGTGGTGSGAIVNDPVVTTGNVLTSVSTSLNNQFPDIEPLQLTVTLRDVVTRQPVYEFRLPANAFESSRNENIDVSASRSDGSALPEYVTFDTDAESFRVDRLQALSLGVEQIDVKVTGEDESGNKASTTFVIYLLAENDENDNTDDPGEDRDSREQKTGNRIDSSPDALPGSMPLADMLKVAGRSGFEAQHSDILADIMTLLAEDDQKV